MSDLCTLLPVLVWLAAMALESMCRSADVTVGAEVEASARWLYKGGVGGGSPLPEPSLSQFQLPCSCFLCVFA